MHYQISRLKGWNYRRAYQLSKLKKRNTKGFHFLTDVWNHRSDRPCGSYKKNLVYFRNDCFSFHFYQRFKWCYLFANFVICVGNPD
jgi:hypothetical protein